MSAFDPRYYQVGPGFWGFLATFVMALAVIVIYRSLSKHLRKIRRDEERAREELRMKSSGSEDREGGGDVVARESGDSE
ncbi:hypothetical protein [Demequina sp.]|uniref:hypothetical protein n=1 Tax=Demequina sp. TaxID=2050685 RepID=UPI0025C3C9A5|nr:hypothetical protein [Demequina sp.]